MEQHLTSATKNGDLDGALAIRKFIASLKVSNALLAMSASDSQVTLPEPFTAQGERWEGVNEAGTALSFEVRRDGKLDFTSGNFKAIWIIEKTGDSEYSTKEPETMKDARGWIIRIVDEDSAKFIIGNKEGKLERTKQGRR